MNNTVLAIATHDFRPACANEPDVVERVRKAMVAAANPVNYSLDYDADMAFRGALGAALLESSDDERDRIERSIKVHKAVVAMLSGVPVDLPAVLAEAGEDVIPIGRMWAAAQKRT